MNALETQHHHLTSEQTGAITRISSRVVWELQCYALEAGFIQLLPIMTSPFTDPLNHEVYPAEISYDGRRLQLTASMIFHKQLALNVHKLNRIFIVSPNIRLEKESEKESSNHLFEFAQFDMELKNASMSDVIQFMDGMIREVVDRVSHHCAEELETIGVSLPCYDTAFPIYSSDELRAKYGNDFERVVSQESKTPCFVTNFKREFYDRETPGVRGHYNNFDLLYPNGMGEGASGAEREFEHDQILFRMEELRMDLLPFSNYLEAARLGYLPRTAGAGLGIQRFVKFLCGKHQIGDVCLFDRTMKSQLVF